MHSPVWPYETSSLYPLDEAQVEALRNQYQAEIRTFKSCAAGCQLPKHSALLVMDANGIILEKSPDRMAFAALQPGFSFAEIHAGTRSCLKNINMPNGRFFSAILR